MMKLDPIIAVKDVEVSANWYQQIFGLKETHGGNEFAVLVSENDEVVICLHKWGEHQHPTMTDPSIPPGNGLILYLKTANIQAIRQKVAKAGVALESDIHLNPNSLKMEFSLKDPDGYYWTVTEFHTYEG
jgi:uncharacterized glyoxalase superfamily protein PhnB